MAKNKGKRDPHPSDPVFTLNDGKEKGLGTFSIPIIIIYAQLKLIHSKNKVLIGIKIKSLVF